MQNKFSPSEAATSFFSFFQAHSKFVLKYMGMYSVFTLAIMAGLGAAGYFEVIGQIVALSSLGKEISPDKAMALFANIKWPLVVPIVIISLLASIAFITMGLRKAVRNEEIGFHGLVWGRDENQLFIAGFQLWLLLMASYLVLIVAIVGITFLKMPILGVLLVVGFILFLIFALGRFGMFGVMTIANKKSGVLDSYNFSKEQFWSFVGAFVLNAIIVMLITAVVQASLGAIFSPLMKDAISGMPSSFAGFFSIGSILYFAAIGAIGGAVRLAMICTGAYAYHKINEASE